MNRVRAGLDVTRTGDWRGHAAAVLLACSLLSACGGSDPASAPPPSTPSAVAPTITAQPLAVTATEGDAATFSVTATGTAPLAYQWKRGGVDIAGANAATYSLAAATLADNGASFAVTVSNSAGSASSDAAGLTVNARVVSASITSSPQSVTVAELQTVTFSVGASGTAPFTYQWQRSTDGVTWSDIAGASAESYVTPQLVRTDSGAQFRAVVNNAANTPVASAAAQLTVTADAAVLLASGGTVSGDNDKIRLEVPPATLLGPTRFTFTPLEALPSLPAGYELVPNTAYRIVHEGPGFVPNMPVSVIFRGTTAVMAKAARAIRMALPGGSAAYQLCPDDSNGTLVPLEDIQQGDAKGALVMCGNAQGSSPPRGSTMVGQVRPAPVAPPIITQEPANIAVATPQPVTFSVVATGQAPLGYEWLRNGVTIPGATSASYTIDAPTASDNGARFSVIVSNSFGVVASREALLTIGNAPLKGPTDIWIDANGDLYVADTFNGAVRKLSTAGVISTYAGPASLSGTSRPYAPMSLALPFGVVSDAAGNLYVAEFQVHDIWKIASDGSESSFPTTSVFAGEPGVFGSTDGTGRAARFKNPQGLAVDGAGNIYVADTGNQTIRKITPAGVVTTLAGLAGVFGFADGAGSVARFMVPRGIASDAVGNVYVADSGNQAIRRITPDGNVTTIAGVPGVAGSNDGAAAVARFRDPPGIAVDAAGNLYVADQGNHTIRKITAGVVTTLAGSAGAPGYADGNGSAARFRDPEGIAVDSAGNVYVADRGNNAIRKITPAGVVTTVF
jgi:sugar lactone lactonase YvrE